MTSPGDVALVPFPMTDQGTFKKRPVLVLSVIPPMGNPDLVVLQVTSSAARLTNRLQGDIVLDDRQAHPKRSIVRCRRIVSLRETDIENVIGSVDTSFLQNAKHEVRSLLGL